MVASRKVVTPEDVDLPVSQERCALACMTAIVPEQTSAVCVTSAGVQTGKFRKWLLYLSEKLTKFKEMQHPFCKYVNEIPFSHPDIRNACNWTVL